MNCPQCKTTMRYKVNQIKDGDTIENYRKIYDCPDCHYREERRMTPTAFMKYKTKGVPISNLRVIVNEKNRYKMNIKW